MKLSRDAWLGIGILVALILVTSAAVLQKTEKVSEWTRPNLCAKCAAGAAISRFP